MCDFFIMINNSNENVPGINPLTDDEGDKLEMFGTLEDAIKRAEENDYIRWCGYEVFERGSGEI